MVPTGRYMYIYAVSDTRQLSLCEVLIYPAKRTCDWCKECAYGH